MEIEEKAKKEKVLETGIPFTNWKESWVEREREYQREIAEFTAKNVALQHNPPKPERGTGVWIHGSPHMAGLLEEVALGGETLPTPSPRSLWSPNPSPSPKSPVVRSRPERPIVNGDLTTSAPKSRQRA